MRLLALAVVCLAIVPACGGGSGRDRGLPTLNGARTCATAPQATAPLVVEWSGATRGQLEALRTKHLVAVRYSGCELEMLAACNVKSQYAYVPLTPKRDHVRVRDESELYANIPFQAATLAAKLRSAGELNVSMSVVGRYDAQATTITPDLLEGDCAAATHVIAGLTTGAFQFYAGAHDRAQGGAHVGPLGGGAASSSSSEMLNQDGDDASCGRATATDTRPPYGCGAIVRIELVPLGGTRPSQPSCPPGLAWDGTQCASRYVPAAAAPAAPAAPAFAGKPGAMVSIRGGAFRSSIGDVKSVATFELDLTETTVQDFRACVAQQRCAPPPTDAGCNWAVDGRANHPINCVSWDDAKSYCEWSGKRLPTDIEWEYAAAGTSGAKYPWGQEPPDETRRCGGRSESWETCPVGLFPAGRSPFGVLDMSGNVAEWTLDAHCSGQGTTWSCSPTARTLRKGIRERRPVHAKHGDRSSGFRCARTVPPAAGPRVCPAGTLYSLDACVSSEGSQCPPGMRRTGPGCVAEGAF